MVHVTQPRAPVFGRGGRRKRRRHRIVPPKGASRLWPKSHQYCRLIGLIYCMGALGSISFLTFPRIRGGRS